MEEAKQDINDISEKKSFVAWAKMHKRAWGMKSRMHREFSANTDGIYQTMVKV